MKRKAIKITYEILLKLLKIEEGVIVTGVKHIPNENGMILYLANVGKEHVEGAVTIVQEHHWTEGVNK